LAKKHAFGVSQALALRVGNHGITARRLTHNGTAIEGVCVTGEAIRPVVPVASKERVPVASRYGVVFAITVRAGYGAIAVKGDGY